MCLEKSKKYNVFNPNSKLLFFSKTKSCGVISIQEKTMQLAKNRGKPFRIDRKGLTRTKDCNTTEDEA